MDVRFEAHLKTITCVFPMKQDKSMKHCSVKYRLCSTDGTVLSNKQQNRHLNNTNNSDHVYIAIPPSDELEPNKKYCFEVVASNDTFSVIVKGSFVVGKAPISVYQT